jgi:hypothetical protein
MITKSFLGLMEQIIYARKNAFVIMALAAASVATDSYRRGARGPKRPVLVLDAAEGRGIRGSSP